MYLTGILQILFVYAILYLGKRIVSSAIRVKTKTPVAATTGVFFLLFYSFCRPVTVCSVISSFTDIMKKLTKS